MVSGPRRAARNARMPLDEDGEPLNVHVSGFYGSEPSAEMQAVLDAIVFDARHAKSRRLRRVRPSSDEVSHDVESGGARHDQGKPSDKRGDKRAGKKKQRQSSTGHRTRLGGGGGSEGGVAEGNGAGPNDEKGGDGADEDEEDEDGEVDVEEDVVEGGVDDSGEGGGDVEKPPVRLLSCDEATAHLREALSAQWATIRSVFSQWDVDGNGSISLAEWRDALARFGVMDSSHEATDAAERLFELLDRDGSGTLDYRELHVALRQSTELGAKLKAGAVAFETEVTQKVALRKQARGKGGGSNTLNGLQLSIEGTSLADQLREALAANLGRTIDLFREWDADGSGWVDKAEFANGLRALGLRAGKREAATLFDLLDESRDGKIEYGELHAKLRAVAGKTQKVAGGGDDEGTRARVGGSGGRGGVRSGGAEASGSGLRAGARAVASGLTTRMQMQQEELRGRLRLPEGVSPKVYALCRQSAQAGAAGQHRGAQLRRLPPVPVLPLTQPVRHRRKGNRLPPIDSLGLVLPPLAESSAAVGSSDAAAGGHSVAAAGVNVTNVALLPALGAPPLREFDTTRAPDGPVTRKQVRISDLSWDDVRQRQEKVGRGRVVELGLRDRWRSNL